MDFRFKAADIAKLESVLGVRAMAMGTYHRFEIAPADPVRKTALEVYEAIRIGTKKGNLISVYTPGSHLQLHFCSGYVVSDVLGEVTFVAEDGEKVSGLIVEKQGGCSLFANVGRRLLSGDFTQLGPEVMLSGIALSLTEGLLEEPGETRKRSARPKTAPAKAPRRKKSRSRS